MIRVWVMNQRFVMDLNVKSGRGGGAGRGAVEGEGGGGVDGRVWE